MISYVVSARRHRGEALRDLRQGTEKIGEAEMARMIFEAIQTIF
jgi:hypothetical protein